MSFGFLRRQGAAKVLGIDISLQDYTLPIYPLILSNTPYFLAGI
jgi:hypothetical protein